MSTQKEIQDALKVLSDAGVISIVSDENERSLHEHEPVEAPTPNDRDINELNDFLQHMGLVEKAENESEKPKATSISELRDALINKVPDSVNEKVNELVSKIRKNNEKVSDQSTSQKNEDATSDEKTTETEPKVSIIEEAKQEIPNVQKAITKGALITAGGVVAISAIGTVAVKRLLKK